MSTNNNENVLQSVDIQISGELTRLIASLKSGREQVKATVASWRESFGNVIRDVSSLKKQSTDAVNSLKGVVTGLTATFSAYKAYSFVKDITLLAARVDVLDVVVKNVGRTAGYTASQIEKTEKEIEQLGITSQAAMQSLTRYIQGNLDLGKATQLARLAQDAAVIAGLNSSETFERMLDGIVLLQPRILHTLGIIVSAENAYAKWTKANNRTVHSLTELEKQSILLNEVLDYGRRLVGTYETAMTKAGKQLLSLQRYQEQFKLSLGREFQPAFSEYIKQLTVFFKEAEKSGQLHKMAQGLSVILLKVFRIVVEIVSFVSSHSSMFVKFLEAAIVYKFTRFLTIMIATMYNAATAASVVESRVAFMNLALSASVGLGTILAVLFGDKFPEATHYAVIAFNALIIAMNGLRMAIYGVETALGPAGWFIIALSTIFSVTSLMTNKMEEYTGAVDTAAQKQSELLEQAKATAMEYKSLRTRALELMREYVTLYESTGLNADSQTRLKEILKQLKEVFPGISVDADNLSSAYSTLKDSISGVSKELAELEQVRLREENAGMQEKLLKVGEEIRNFSGRNINNIRGLAEAVLEASKTDNKENLVSAMTAFRKAYIESLDALAGNITKTKNENLQKANQALVNEALKLGATVQVLFDSKTKVLDNMKTIMDLVNGLPEPDKPVKKFTPIDPKKIEEAKALMLEFQEKMTQSEMEQGLLRIEIWKNEQDVKLDELKKAGVDISRLQVALNKSVADQTAELVKSSEEKALKTQEETLKRKSTLDKKYMEQYQTWIEQRLDLLIYEGKFGTEQYDELYKTYTELQEQATQKSREESEKRQKQWLSEHKTIQGVLGLISSSYHSLMDTLVDFEISGKARRERVWKSLLSSFIHLLDQMVVQVLLRKALLFFLNFIPGFGNLFNSGTSGGSVFPDAFGGSGITSFNGGSVFPSPSSNSFNSLLNRIADSFPTQLNLEVELTPVPLIDNKGVYLSGVRGKQQKNIVRS